MNNIQRISDYSKFGFVEYYECSKVVILPKSGCFSLDGEYLQCQPIHVTVEQSVEIFYSQKKNK